MKKVISAFSIIVLLFTIMPTSTTAAANFKDVPKNAFYRDDLNFIVNDSRHILEGYKGSFNPDGALSVAQFIKIVVAASGKPVPAAQKNEKWYVPYVNKAKEMGYVKSKELGNCERDITRGEIARIMVRVLEKSGEKPQYRSPENIRFLIRDYNSLPPDLKDYIVKAYDVGLVGGYSDGTFGPYDKFTRAQAVVIVRRLLDPSKRIKLDINAYISKFTKSYDGISFNSYTDVTGNNNVMKLEKAQVFAMRFYYSLSFYMKDGKPYIRGKIPKLPGDYVFYVKIDLNPGKDGYSYSTNSTKKNYLISSQGSFDIKVTRSLSRKEIRKITVSAAIYTVTGDSEDYADGMFKLYFPDRKLLKFDRNKIGVDMPYPSNAFAKW